MDFTMEEEYATPQNRFKYQSHTKELKEVHLPSALNQSQRDHDFESSECQFHDALQHWRQLNLSPSFVTYANKSHPLSASLPLLLHNWREVVDLWIAVTVKSDDEGLKALLDIFQKLVIDLRGTLLPAYNDILDALLRLLARSISAASLTTLLSTFTLTFKHLLVPSTGISLLESTWTAIQRALIQCQPEVQRAMAEVWGSLLRRLKTLSREKAVFLAADNLSGVEDVVAWVFVSACKSVSQTLHTAAPSIIAPLVDYYLACRHDSQESTYTLLRRVLTALIHHVKNPTSFSPIGDFLCDRFTAITESTDLEMLRRLCEVLAVGCSVRHGSRMTGKHVSTILLCVQKVPVTDETYTAVLKLASSILIGTAGDMALWMGSGRRFLEHVWSLAGNGQDTHVKFVLALHGTLVEMNWGGWKMIALPVLLKRSITLLDGRQCLDVLRLLAKVHEEGRIGDVDVVWKRGIDAWLHKRLALVRSADELSSTMVAELSYACQLSPYISTAVTPIIASIVDEYLLSDCATDVNGEADLKETRRRLLSVCLQYITGRPYAEWSSHIDLSSWTTRLISQWSHSPDMMSALTELREKAPNNSPLPFEETFERLRGSLLSHDATLRLHALKMLNVSSNAPDVLNRCLAAEEVMLDVRGVRERTLKTSKVAQGAIVTTEAAEICVRWLLAQLKVNVKPLWACAAKTLAELAEGGWGQVVWDIVWDELKDVMVIHVKGSDTAAREENPEEAEDWEDERTWRDPSAHKLRVVIAEWQRDPSEHAAALRASGVNSRFDRRSYILGILDVLGQCPFIAEKHNRDLVPLFLSQIQTLLQQRQHFTAYLNLFAKFSNPKACFQSEQLQSVYFDLLAHPDRNLQTAALSCVLTYKSPPLLQWRDKFTLLLDNTRWRDELTNLSLGEAESEVAVVVIRLLYGIMLERKGKSRRGNERRSTILGVLGACSESDLEVLVQLMLKSLDSGEGLLETNKQRVGFLTLLGDVLKNLGSRLVAYWPALLQKTLQLVESAQAQLGSGPQEDGEGDDGEENGDEQEQEYAHGTKSTRVIRQLGIKRFTDFFRIPVDFNFEPYVKMAFEVSISPRIPVLDRENTQSPSSLLELFSVWSHSDVCALYLVRYNTALVPKIFDCLIATNVKPAVVSKVFDIAETLLALDAIESTVLESVIRPNIGHLLTNLSIMAERMKGTEDSLAQRQINVLSQIAQYSTNRDEAITLFKLFAPLLRKSHKVVAEKVKADILKIVAHLIPLIPELSDSSSDVFVRLLASFSQLFQSLRFRNARLSLVDALKSLATVNPSLDTVADLMAEWNSYSKKRIDEADFDRRLKAFATFESLDTATLPLSHWSLALHQTLYSIHDPDELAIRTSSSSVLRRFIDLVASSQSTDNECVFSRLVLVGMKNGLRSKNELVRAEILGVLSYSVQQCKNIAAVKDMRVLLANGDDEVNFFNNIHHVQIHRRSRAVRRLADQCDEQPLRSGTLVDFILPLVSNYIVAPTPTNHHLINDAIATIGRLSKHLAWGAYYAIVQRYMRLAKAKDDAERVYVRTLVSILDHFHFSMEQTVPAAEAHDDDEVDGEPEVAIVAPDMRVSNAVNNRLLPELLKFIESRDSTTEDTTRVPIATGIIKVALHLPADVKDAQITRLLTITSQILRSRSQETRDLTRDTLVHIAVNLGPGYLRLMIQELRGALLRGPHLHVLAVTTHALLTHVTSEERSGTFHTLDDCVGDVSHLASEVIFGESGKDVQAEDFKTKMREVRGSASKGLDTFAIMAKHITPPYITGLLVPLRAIMHQTVTSKTLGSVDEVLKRIVSGLNVNKYLDAEQLLSVCHTLISQDSKFLKEAPTRRKSKAKGDAIVQLKRREDVVQDHYGDNSYRFVVLGLDLFQTALRRNRFDFRDSGIISRLESMLVVVGNSLYSSNGPVLVMSLKCISALVKCPLRSWGKSLPVLTRQTIEIIKQAGSTESDLVQAALKSLAVVLRDGPSADVREKDLAFLLELISPDLEETSRQSTVFMVLRAIVARKFVVPEIYDLMEKVSEVMVTSQSAQVQELCRGLLLQFLLDYPQGKGRLRTQMTFFAKNLSYVYESGRKSVMEILGAIIAKFQTNLVQEYADVLFVALVMVIANDDSAKCVEIASQLIKTLIIRLDEDRRSLILSHLHSWASQTDKPRLSQISSQVCGIFIEALGDACRDRVPGILSDVNNTLKTSASQLEEAESAEDAMDLDWDWQSPYHSLLVISKLLNVFPDLTNAPDVIDWDSTVTLLLFPHPWVRTAACRLLGILYGAAAVGAPPDSSFAYPLGKPGMLDVAKKLALQLKSAQLDEALGLQIVKNLFHLGKCFSVIPSTASGDDSQDERDEEDDEPEPGGIDDPLPWLFSKLSYQARSAHIARRNRHSQAAWGNQPLAVLRWFAAMTSFLDAPKVESFLVHILSPVYRFIEDDTVRDNEMDEVKTLATELQDLIQSKVGATAFSNVYNRIRQGVIGVRRERRTQRALQVATNPAAAAKRKGQKNVMKKDSRKRKNESFADRRGKIKRHRPQ